MRTECGLSQSKVQLRNRKLFHWAWHTFVPPMRKCWNYLYWVGNNDFCALIFDFILPSTSAEKLWLSSVESISFEESSRVFAHYKHETPNAHKNGEERWGIAVAQAALQLLFLFTGPFLTTFPLCPHHACSGLQVFLPIWTIHLKVSPFPPPPNQGLYYCFSFLCCLLFFKHLSSIS